MQDCIIFCAGIHGACVYEKLSRLYRVAAYSDNNEALWGLTVNGVPVLPPAEIVPLSQKGALIFVCNLYAFQQIAAQLDDMGAENIYCIPGGILYNYADGVMLPVRGQAQPPYRKEGRKVFSILYVQTWPCQRTNKIASVVKVRDVEVHIAYTLAPPKKEWRIYDGEHEFWDLTELADFVRNSEFDVVHYSNEPDCFTNLLISTGKPVIHDTHDMTSLFNASMDGLLAEHLANTSSQGCLYPTPGMRNIALQKYQIAPEKALVVENLPLESFLPQTRLEKLSAADGKLHCVYEGTINPSDSDHYSFDGIWMQLAEAGVHVHFYSTADSAVCERLAEKSPYLHYEGSVGLRDLLLEMTRYDCGLLLFPPREREKMILELSSPNKLYEYLGAGLPIAASEISWFRFFAEELCCGGFLDMKGDIETQLRVIAAVEIAPDFLQKNGLTMDARAEEILAFYKRAAGMMV